MNVVGWVTLAVTLLAGILGHIGFFIWWASKINTTLFFMKLSLDKLEKEKDALATKNELTKESTSAELQHKAMWKRIDEFAVRVDGQDKEIFMIKEKTKGSS